MAPTILLDAWAVAMWRACWQGGLLVLAVWSLCRLIPSMPARYQCWFWRLALLKFLMVLFCPALLNLPLLPAAPVPTSIPEVGLPVATEMPVAMDLPASPTDSVPAAPSEAMKLPSLRTMLGFAWIVGVGWSLAWLLAAWYEAIRTQKQSHSIACMPLIEQLAIQGRLFGLRNLPRLIEVKGSGSPMLIGTFRPAIVFPTDTLGHLSIAERTMVLGHELAHIRRGDLFWGFMASIVRAVFFFHPLAWWSERQLKLAQEVAADELAIARQRHKPVIYAGLLVSVVGKLGHRPLASTISVETAGNVHSLARRLAAMTCIGRTSRRVVVSSAVLLAGVVLLGLVPWRLVAAEPKEGDRQATVVDEIRELGGKDAPHVLPPHQSRDSDHKLTWYRADMKVTKKRGQPEKSRIDQSLKYTAGTPTIVVRYFDDPTRVLAITASSSLDGQPVEHTIRATVIRDRSGKKLTVGDKDWDRLVRVGLKDVLNCESRSQKIVDLPKGSQFSVVGSFVDGKPTLDGSVKVQCDTKAQFGVSDGRLDAKGIAWQSVKIICPSRATGKITAMKEGGDQLDIEVTISPSKPPRNAAVLDGGTTEINPEQAKVIAEIKKLGGKVIIDKKSPGKPVIGVELRGTKVTDAGLEHLKRFSQLHTLNLMGTRVTDAGLEHLTGLSQLRMLVLGYTWVTDAGLEHLKGLSQLQALALLSTRVTDVGLEHLKGLSQLRMLDVDGTRVTDAGLEHLKGLSQLRSLNIGRSRITDAGLEHLKGLTQLQELLLDGTPVTDAGLQQLKGLSQLQTLWLGNTKITDAGLEYLNGFSQLWHVDLNGTQVTDAGLEHYKGLSQLQRLNLNGTKVTDASLDHLKGLSQLRSLFLGNTAVTDVGVEKLKGLPQLQWLDLGNTRVTDAGLEHLKGFSQLQMLVLGNTRVTDAGVERLKGLTQLQMLVLDGTRVTEAGLEQLKGFSQLQHLNLLGTKVTDADVKRLQQALPNCRIAHGNAPSRYQVPAPGMKSSGPSYRSSPVTGITKRASGRASETNPEQAKAIAAIKKLGGMVTRDEKSLDRPVIAVHLLNTKVTDAGLGNLERLTELRELCFVNTNVTDAGLEHLKGLTNLQTLQLSGTEVTDAGLEHLKGLTKLRELDLWYTTRLTDAGLEHLKGLTKLQGLGLAGTQVTDAGLEHLKGLTKLEGLGLTGTRVTGAGLEHLKGLTKLSSLNLTNTKVTDAGLEHLTGLTKLQWLNLMDTNVTDAGLEHLKALTNLGWLFLGGCKHVTDAGLEHLRGLTKSKRLAWEAPRSPTQA